MAVTTLVSRQKPFSTRAVENVPLFHHKNIYRSSNSSRLPTISIPSTSFTLVEQPGNLSISTGNLQPIVDSITPLAITQIVNVTDTDIRAPTPEYMNPPNIAIDDNTDHVDGDQTNPTMHTYSGKKLTHQRSYLFSIIIPHLAVFNKPPHVHFDMFEYFNPQ